MWTWAARGEGKALRQGKGFDLNSIVDVHPFHQRVGMAGDLASDSN